MSQAVSQTGVELTSTVYCDESGTFRAEYDRDTTAASMAVVTTVSQFLGVAPTDMAPLQHTVDTGALDSLSLEQPAGGTVLTTFVYECCEVSVSTEGAVTVSPLDGDDTDHNVQGQDPDGSVSR
jgi:hypothetical protein